MDLMFKHKIKKGVPPSLSVEWDPPIRAALATFLADPKTKKSRAGNTASAAAGAEADKGGSMRMIYKNDIQCLIDNCYEKVSDIYFLLTYFQGPP